MKYFVFVLGEGRGGCKKLNFLVLLMATWLWGCQIRLIDVRNMKKTLAVVDFEMPWVNFYTDLSAIHKYVRVVSKKMMPNNFL